MNLTELKVINSAIISPREKCIGGRIDRPKTYAGGVACCPW